MTVEELIRELSDLPPHLEIQIVIGGSSGVTVRYSVDRIKRGQEGPEHFVGIEG
jgi:hypothetical protein